MSLGRFHGFPDVQPWDRLYVIGLGVDADTDPETIDMFEEVGVQTRGFILSDNLIVECVAWGAADQDAFLSVPFPVGTYFGSVRKFKKKGVGSATTGSATVITFFA